MLLRLRDEAMKSNYLAIFALVFASLPISSSACSMSGCSPSETELRSNFAIRISHDNKPLPAVTVKLARSDGTRVVELLSQETDAGGILRITKLPPGNYWLHAELLGISAGERCFHVAATSSWKARKQINFEWGDEASATREAAGKLVHTQVGHGDSPLWNITHPAQVPISNARLSLRAPQSDASFSTASDEDGHFTFGEIPDGLYVLRVEASATANGGSIEPVNLLFRLSRSASRRRLFVDEADPIGGSCGGWSIEPDYTSGL
jgi:Carboxypeptidase regulatory-like domain